MNRIIARFRKNHEGFWQSYWPIVVVFIIALLCDGLSTVHFMLIEGPEGETHPAVYYLSTVTGPVAGPMLGVSLKVMAGIGVGIYFRKYAIYLFVLASVLGFWAAWYNIWGHNIYVPVIFELFRC